MTSPLTMGSSRPHSLRAEPQLPGLFRQCQQLVHGRWRRALSPKVSGLYVAANKSAGDRRHSRLEGLRSHEWRPELVQQIALRGSVSILVEAGEQKTGGDLSPNFILQRVAELKGRTGLQVSLSLFETRAVEIGIRERVLDLGDALAVGKIVVEKTSSGC